MALRERNLRADVSAGAGWRLSSAASMKRPGVERDAAKLLKVSIGRGKALA
jgi:hypothetical protein